MRCLLCLYSRAVTRHSTLVPLWRAHLWRTKVLRVYPGPRAVTPRATHTRFAAVDLLALEFELKQKMQKYPRVRLHIVCFLATVSQYRINYGRLLPGISLSKVIYENCLQSGC